MLSSRLNSERFKVLVIGEFKRGKSTFINAMLGEEVLPAFATPCTAVINEIKWGEEKAAVLHFKSPVPSPLPMELPDAVRQHLSGSKKDSIPEMDISVEDLEEYVVIPDPAKNQAASVAESPYSMVEIHWPLELCKNGVEIIDSPGLNEHTNRSRITSEYLSKVDAVIFVMSCQALASQSELSFVDNQIRATGHEEIFFVANRFDEIRERDRDRLVRYGHAKLDERTKFGRDGVFFLSAMDALDGREENSSDLVTKSGMLPLEERLAHFLTHDRGRVKLLQPARETVDAIRRARDEFIPRQLEMLELSVEELQERYDNVRPALEDAETRRSQIIKKLDNHRDRLKGEITREARARIRELVSLIPEWANEIETESTIDFLSLSGTKDQVKALAQETSEKLGKRMEQEQIAWQRETLQPMISERLNEMTEGIQQNVDDFLKGIDAISTTLSGLVNKEAEEDEHHPGALERVLSAAGGFVVAGAGSALVGATLGFKEMAKSLIPQAAIAVGLILVGVTNPWIIIPALIGAGSLQAVLKTGKIYEAIRSKVVEQMCAQMKDQLPELAEQMAESVYAQTQQITDAIENGLQSEINSCREQVEVVLRDLRSGTKAVGSKKTVLKQAQEELGHINNSLVDMIVGLSMG